MERQSGSPQNPAATLRHNRCYKATTDHPETASLSGSTVPHFRQYDDIQEWEFSDSFGVGQSWDCPYVHPQSNSTDNNATMPPKAKINFHGFSNKQGYLMGRKLIINNQHQ